ncbi:hypothetical protein E1B28_003366 [Marasmius oreades]|uniref:Uncharacterized protein n=1 Tax=Marasmius oreades TaxID=181124 RepID=A0A9P7RMX5_9AGAR|nr:uncharacterized protein E1B28_003366 [Marasmius oreades]KAG7085828.1 hypothetical protein E1B28_003366 [Marasmius oreades]
MTIQEVLAAAKRLGLSINEPDSSTSPPSVSMPTNARTPKSESASETLPTSTSESLESLCESQLAGLAHKEFTRLMTDKNWNVNSGVPWKILHEKLAKKGCQLINYPADVSLPWSHDGNKGIQHLTKPELMSLIQQFSAAENPLQLVAVEDHTYGKCEEHFLCDVLLKSTKRGKSGAGKSQAVSVEPKGKSRAVSKPPGGKKRKLSTLETGDSTSRQMRSTVKARKRTVWFKEEEEEEGEDQLESELSLIESEEDMQVTAPPKSDSKPGNIPAKTPEPGPSTSELIAPIKTSKPNISLAEFESGGFVAHERMYFDSLMGEEYHSRVNLISELRE